MKHYPRVPKDLQGNLRFRKELLRLGQGKQAAKELWQACADDLLFFVNAFLFGYEPRLGEDRRIVYPFISWDYQDPVLLKIDSSIEAGKDLLIEKSRDMGATWMVLIVFFWRWLFKEMNSFLLVSRKEELVDERGDQDTLFWKLDFMLSNLPLWLKPNFERTFKLLQNSDRGGTVAGESTNADVGAGGRKTGVLLDEFARVLNGHEILAATADTTDCRVFNSTPQGTANAFYDMVQKLPSEQKIRLHWTLHPIKAKGLYYDHDGRPRSPWYDEELIERRSRREAAVELDIDYQGSNYQFFDPLILTTLTKRDCREPYVKLPAKQFCDRAGGDVLLWCNLDPKGDPPKDRQYVIACDVAAGTGASNSAISVADRKTGDKVAEYASPFLRPPDLAQLAVEVAKFFKGSGSENAYMIWEANGFGRNFGSRVMELGHNNVYFRTDELGLARKVSDVPGWYSSPDSKRELLTHYREALGKDFINRSAEALAECGQYIFDPANQSISHAGAVGTQDPSGARANHGDRVIADALAWKALKERGLEKQVKYSESDPPANTLAYRRKYWRDVERKREEELA